MSTNAGGKNQQSPSFVPRRDEENIDSSNGGLLEPLTAEQHAPSYTIFLIPEVPSFELTGKLAELLSEGLKQICDSKGWKLEFVTVDAKYLQWAMSVPSAPAAVQIIQLIRPRLSEQIYSNISEETEMKNSIDFWAQGYLLLYGLHPHPDEIIEQYILLVRRQKERH